MRAAQRAGHGAGLRRGRRSAGRRGGRGGRRHRAGAPRVGLPAGADRDRGGAQGRAAARRGRDLQPGARHRHGRGRPGHPGRVAAVGGQRAAAGRPRRAQRRRRLARRDLPQVRRRPGAGRRGGRPDAGRRDRGAAHPAQPARRARPAGRRDGRARRLGGRRPGGSDPAVRAVRHADQARARGGARHARRALPGRGVRRAQAAGRVGPGGRGDPRPAGRAEAGGDQRRDDPGPGLLRRVPARRRGVRPGAAPGRRARRGDGVRVAGRRRVRARRLVVADRGHHARPGAGAARARPAGQAAVLARRHAGAARRARQGPRRQGPRAGRAARGGGRRVADRERPRPARRAATSCRTCPTSGPATGHVPDDRTLVVERFRDELGDWRVVLHSPYGDRVHAPWALAITARLRERYGGMDVQALHTDDGIIIRVPDSDEPPPAGIALLDPEEIGDIITAEVGGSALFASRFRECAARALLLPRRQPGRRTPLWQQRQRSAQLLEIAGPVPRVPDHAGDRQGVPAGRVRRARADRGAPRPRRAPDPRRGGGDGHARARSGGTCSSGTSARSCTRGTRRSPSGARRRSRSTRRCSRSCSAPRACASCSTRPSSRRPRPTCSTCPSAQAVQGRGGRRRPAAHRRGR